MDLLFEISAAPHMPPTLRAQLRRPVRSDETDAPLCDFISSYETLRWSCAVRSLATAVNRTRST